MGMNVLIFATAVALSVVAPRLAATPLLLCGDNEMFLVDPDSKTPTTKLWRWSGVDVKEFSKAEKSAFNHLDECKPAFGGKRILVTASNGGCAIVERPSGRVLWHAAAVNAHSIELLPQDRVAVASSLGGDRLLIFDLSSTAGAPVWSTPMPHAHGLCWDKARHCLWTLNFDELRRYELSGWETAVPSLKLVATHKLPDKEGHDLRPVPNTGDLVLTTENHVWLFDRDKGVFRPHPVFADCKNMKSVDIHPKSGRIVTTDWTHKVRFQSPAAEISFEREIPYKSRWLVEGETKPE